MKKLIAILAACAMTITMLCGCNKQLIDLTYNFDYAIISLPNGEVVEGEISSWKDFDDGDQIQVVVNGVTYLVHSSQVTLMNK